MGGDAVPPHAEDCPCRFCHGETRRQRSAPGQRDARRPAKRCDLAIWDIDSPAELRLSASASIRCTNGFGGADDHLSPVPFPLAGGWGAFFFFSFFFFFADRTTAGIQSSISAQMTAVRARAAGWAVESGLRRSEKQPAYGINPGFGKLAEGACAIAPGMHWVKPPSTHRAVGACGRPSGAADGAGETVRLMMARKLASLRARCVGCTGRPRWRSCKRMVGPWRNHRWC